MTVILNGFKAQTGSLEIKKDLVMIDQSHENAYKDFFKAVEGYLTEQGLQVRYNLTYLKSVPSTSYFFLPLPKKGAFPELMALNDFEIDNLVSYHQRGGKILFVALPDSVVEASYNRLLERFSSKVRLVQNDRILFQVGDLLFDRYIDGSILFISCEQPQDLQRFIGGIL